MWSVYIIRSEVYGTLYTGMSTDFNKRLEQHNKYQVKSTKFGVPWKEVYVEQGFRTAKIARKRERYLKSTSGKNWL